MNTLVTHLRGSRDAKDLAILAVVWTLMIVLVNPIGDFPLNDDWVYAAGVRSLLDQGYFQVSGFSSANVGPQMYWGALFCLPFGFSFTALRMSSLTLGLIGGWAAYGLLTEVWGNRALALTAGLLLLTNPVYFGLANSFMTDVPFLALVLAAMFLIVKGMRREQTGVIVGGLVLSILGVLLRQFALVILLGFAVAHLAKRGFSWRRFVSAVLPVLVGLTVHFVFSRWMLESGRKPYPAGIADITPHSASDLLRTALRESFVALCYIGLFVTPMIAACIPISRIRFVWTQGRYALGWVALSVVGFGFILLVQHEAMPLGQNVLTYFGMGPLTQRDTYLLARNWPLVSPGLSTFWKLVTGVSIIGMSLLGLAFAMGTRRLVISIRNASSTNAAAWQPVFFTTIAISYFGVLLVIAARYVLFDRYLLLAFVLALLAVPVLGCGTGGSPFDSRARKGFVVTLLVAFGTFSVISTHDYLEWNRARWTALGELKVQQISPYQIDGGYEFNGWLLYDPLFKAREGKSWWWVYDDEYVLASGNIPGYHEVHRVKVHRWFPTTHFDVLVLKRLPVVP